MEKTDNQKIRLGLFIIIGSILFFAAIYFTKLKEISIYYSAGLECTSLIPDSLISKKSSS